MNRADDRSIRRAIRAALPASCFVPNPQRLRCVLPYVLLLVCIHWLVISQDPGFVVALSLSITLGLIQGALMFFAHEVSHGAVARRGLAKAAVQYAGCASFLLSPHLWNVWHNRVHHAQVGTTEDPDHFGTEENFHRIPRMFQPFVRFWPGMSRFSVLYLFCFFTIQGLDVLFRRSRFMAGFTGLRRRRAVFDSALMAAGWLAYALFLGAEEAVLLILLPMAIANLVVLAYILTNHLLMPLAETPHTLATTASVENPPLIDRLTFHFSHHVEHHLFPAMPSCHYPKVRAVLRERFGDEYVLLPHLRALRLLFSTPRFYAEGALVDPLTGRRVEFSERRLPVFTPAARSGRQ